jgi:hypothetical protein
MTCPGRDSNLRRDPVEQTKCICLSGIRWSQRHPGECCRQAEGERATTGVLGVFALVLRLAVRLAVARDTCGDIPRRVRAGVLGRTLRDALSCLTCG